MGNSRTPGPFGSGSSPGSLDDGTSARALSPLPGLIGSSLGSGASGFGIFIGENLTGQRLAAAVKQVSDGASLQKLAVALLGPQCFSAGVIAGAGADIIGSATDLLKLAKTFVLADLHDLSSGKISSWTLLNPRSVTRLLTAKLLDAAFEEELRASAAARDTLIHELSQAVNDPKAFFGNISDALAESLKKDWRDYNTYMSAGTLEGRFRAGMIVGKLLIAVIGIIAGVVGVAKTAGAGAGKLPRLTKLTAKLGPRAGDLNGPAGGSSAPGAAPGRPASRPKKTARRIEEQPPANVPKVPKGHTEPTGPKGGKPEGTPKKIRPEDDAATRRSLQRENESADKLAQAGYNVRQQHDPDLLVEGKPFDVKAPETARVRNAAKAMEDALKKGQADRFVLNLEDSPITLPQMRQQLTQYPIEGLKEVIVIKGGQVTPLWP